MSFNNEMLINLKEQVKRKEFLTDELRRLNKYRYEFRADVLQLKHIMENEQQDVDKIQNPGLASFFYNLTGKYEQKFDKEYREAREAADKYEAAALELQEIDDTLERYEHEFRQLTNVEKEYKAAFEDKLNLIKSSDNTEASIIIEMDKQVEILRNEIKEVDEASKAGYDLVGDYKCMLVLSDEIMRFRSIYDPTAAQHEEFRQNCRSLDSLKGGSIRKLDTLSKSLIKVSAFAKKYDETGMFLYGSNIDIEYSSDPRSMLWRVEPIYNSVNRIYENVEKKYNEIFTEFENRVLKIGIYQTITVLYSKNP